jgi:hypothetical protein
MKTVHSHETKAKTPPVPVSKRREPPSFPNTPSNPSMSPCEDLHGLISRRAYKHFSERGCLDGSALDDWLDAEREILGQIPSV